MAKAQAEARKQLLDGDWDWGRRKEERKGDDDGDRGKRNIAR